MHSHRGTKYEIISETSTASQNGTVEVQVKYSHDNEVKSKEMLLYVTG